ncbi:isoprenylcysteine carboxylmethyltransferase family protein [Deinococcus sp.]|uniref:methyltransferase family protein n=1 Tax=Deinococcus sp. TaxID=47478 RepID=UPI002869B602|nr:isoprenylcysteine carboxylmethyltransferase family protein [Deinococcus sp.]
MTRPESTFLKRGGAFVMAQFVLLGMIGVSGVRHRRGSRLGLVLIAAGVALGARGGRTLGRNLTPLPEPLRDGQLVTGGAYASMRHPIYAALLLLSVGWSVLRGSRLALSWTAALALLFHFKANHEEAALERKFPEYAAYRARVKRVLPGVY